ncbi:hypothetical protein Forpe1208_v009149 [Fusarium oxysporum f. sp. rapae]|uniref:Uncharacterized protein n=1 Tax=Fusarium oxysporum f. sp. rapae TaxID=485398 RepID=A0A8J5NRS0_FUSOX|nr:hypothetical protein Forpe1208_v009149 [Fusarium oxysporum f. sp. rapae]
MDMKAEFAYPSSSKLALKHTIRCTTCNETHATRYCPRADENAISLYAEDQITADDGVSCNAFASRGAPKSEGKRVAFRGQEHAARKPPASVKTEIKNEYKRAAKALQSSAQQDGGGGGEAPGDE